MLERKDYSVILLLSFCLVVQPDYLDIVSYLSNMSKIKETCFFVGENVNVQQLIKEINRLP